MSYKLKSTNPSTSGDVMEATMEDLGLVSLEPRILLDAAGFVTGAEVAMDAMVTEGAQQGVEAIFNANDVSDDPTATPRGGPWLGEITLLEGDAPINDPTATPRGGPWL